MSISIGFILSFVPVAISGSLLLRWFQLAFLYNTLDKYFSDIGITLGVTVLLVIIASIIVCLKLKPFDAIVKRISSGGAKATTDEKIQCLKIQRTITKIMIVVYFLGFFVGQLAVSSIEVIVGVTELNIVNIMLAVAQATTLGALFLLITLNAFSSFISKYKKMLEIQDLSILGKNKGLKITTQAGIIFGFSMVFVIINFSTVPMGILNSNIEYTFEDFISRAVKASVVSFVCVSVPFCIFLQSLDSRLKDTASRISDIAEKGDLSNRINISSTDDLGQVLSNINELINNLSSMVINMKQGTGVVSNSAKSLTDVANSAISALEDMKDAFYLIDENVKSQNQYIEIADKNVEELTADVETVKHHIQEQSAAIQQTSASISEMTANIASVADLTQKADEVSQNLSNASTIGTESISNAMTAISQIQQASLEVQDIIKVIQKISSQTNLLAMNAAIEAAHAGEVGKGFAVVADEVRSLATSSGKSATDIQQHIKDMVDKINSGVEAMNSASGAFKDIAGHVDTNVNLTKTIAAAMDEQRTGAEETLKTTAEIVDAIHAIQVLTENESKNALALKDAMKNVVNASKQAEEVVEASSVSSNALQNALDKVSESIKDNENAVASMKKDIDIFVV